MNQRDLWLAIGLLWLAGAGLRMSILAVPPVIPGIQADLSLSGTAIGALSALPIVLFAVAALPGSLLIARFGALQTLVAGLLIAAAGTALRGAMPAAFVLFAGTFVMGAGIAIMQPALPALVRQWLPHRVGFGTAVYTNGLLVGETIPVMLMLPLVVPVLGDSWRAGLAVWALPMALVAVLVALFAPRSHTAGTAGTRPQWWPDWNSLTWRLGLILASVNSIYFGTNAFLPVHLAGAGRPDLISASLTALNFAQLPSSFLLLAIAGSLERRAWPFIASALALLVAMAGIVLTASAWTIVFAGLLGFAGAFALTLGFALPALLCAPGDVARTSAAMFAVGYSAAVLTALAGGAAWDLTGDPRAAFLPLALIALPQLVLPSTLRFGRAPAL
jgi:CP family cyanate transporter-like MFS transporter